MISYLRGISSLNNWSNNHHSGQIATLLMLMMVAVLILILVTVNLGNISLQATNLSNAADSASLYLASQLATKSNMLWESLGRTTEKCKKGGFAGLIGAIIGAIIAIVAVVLAVPSGGTSLIGAAAFLGLQGTAAVVAAGAVGGAIGGAAGGAYAGTGVLQGAIQGLMIGAAIGGGVATGADLLGGGTVAGSGGTTVNVAVGAGGAVPETVILAPGAAVPASTTGIVSGSTTFASQTGAAIGAIGGGVLSPMSNIYMAVVADQMTSAAFSAAAKALSGLPEYDRYREGVFLQALSQTIDDPNKTQDIYDFDGDGDTQEKVPYFQYWWDRRTAELKGIVPTLKSLTQNFINAPLTDFQNSAKNQYTQICSTIDDQTICTAGPLSRQEVEGSDGALVELTRALEDAGYGISFYKPGKPPLDSLDCDECNPEEYYDEVDAVMGDLKNFVDIAQGLKEQDIYQLTSTWNSWIKWFYDPDSSDDYYDTLKKMIEGEDNFKGLNGWKDEIEDKRKQLPQCIYGQKDEFGTCAPGGGGASCVTNPPCQDGSFGTIDSDLVDEFSNVQNKIAEISADIQDFRTASYNFYTDMNKTYGLMATDYGGINPVTYNWKDSRGQHSVEAEVGPFKIARIVKKKSGGFLKKKICLKLVDYSDNGSNTWLRIIRNDPIDKEIKSGKVALGKWNPSPYKGKISRLSRTYYSYDKVGIYGKD